MTSKIQTLRKPLTVDGSTVAEVTLREPTGGEMRAAEGLKDGIAITIKVLSLITGLAEGTVRAMGARDLRAAGDYVAGFVVEAPPEFDPADLPESKTFPLDPPVKGLDGDLASLTLTEPTAGQMSEYEPLNGFARKVRAVATVAGLPDVVAARLTVRQLNAMEAYLDAFLADVPGAGVTS